METVEKDNQVLANDSPEMVLGRLERIPYAKSHKKLFYIGSFAYLFDSYDGIALTLALPTIVGMWGIASGEQGILTSMQMIGALIGSLLGGALADTLGRKKMMVASIIWFGVFAVAHAAAFNVWMLMAFRFLCSIGLGAAVSILSPYISEFMPASKRAQVSASLLTVAALGTIVATLLALVFVRENSESWRWLMIFGGLPALAMPLIIKHLSESPRWLIGQGKVKEADEVVTGWETATMDALNLDELPEPQPVSLPKPAEKKQGLFANYAKLFNKHLIKSTIACFTLFCVVSFAYWIFAGWMPTLLAKQGYEVVKSTGVMLIFYVCMVPAPAIAGKLMDVIGRKQTIILFLSGSFVGALGMGFASELVLIIIAGCITMFFLQGLQGITYSYVPENFPTSVRTTAMGATVAFGKIGSIAGPIVVGFTLDALGFNGVFMMIAAVLIFGIVIIGIFGANNKGVSLDAIDVLLQQEEALKA